MRKTKTIYLVYIIIIIILGLLSRSSFAYQRFPDDLLKVVGDALWATMFYFIFLLLFSNLHYWYTFFITVIFSWLIECSQLLQFSWLIALRKTPLRYLLGQGFHSEDLFSYILGALLGVIMYQVSCIILRKVKL